MKDLLDYLNLYGGTPEKVAVSMETTSKLASTNKENKRVALFRSEASLGISFSN
jgi:hypothetical protein